MKFVFWQNIISIHQSAFLSALAENYPVILVVEKKIEEQRKDHGWNIPSMGKSNVVIAPSKDQIYRLINNNIDSIHVFAGTHAFPMVGKAFDIACSFKIKILVYAEPYRFIGIKGWLRKCKYQIDFLKYGKCIDALLPTGILGCRCYQKAGFPENKMFQWGYFTEPPEEILNFKENSHLPSLLFVGSIDERKNILYLINICKKIQDQFDHLSIVGVGKLTEQLKESIQGINNIHYLGYRSNTEVKELMFQHDILVLPSIFDGWGAVVNEALQCGMSVISSENCGASILLDGHQRGETFFFSKGDNLETVLRRWLKKGNHTNDRWLIIEWAKKNISGNSVASYFIRICTYLYGEGKERPDAPWL